MELKLFAFNKFATWTPLVIPCSDLVINWSYPVGLGDPSAIKEWVVGAAGRSINPPVVGKLLPFVRVLWADENSVVHSVQSRRAAMCAKGLDLIAPL